MKGFGVTESDTEFIHEELRIRDEMMLIRSCHSGDTDLFPESHCLDKLKIIAVGQEKVLRNENCLRMCDKWEL